MQFKLYFMFYVSAIYVELCSASSGLIDADISRRPLVLSVQKLAAYFFNAKFSVSLVLKRLSAWIRFYFILFILKYVLVYRNEDW